MQYTVVHSNDPYLLARLATDLQMHSNPSWVSETESPFDKGFEWLTCYFSAFKFYDHKCTEPDKGRRHELTSRNYIKVLTQILQP